MEAGAFSPIHIGWTEAAIRVTAATILPFLIGIERFLRKKPIDYRPFVIVSAAACALSLAVMELAHRPELGAVEMSPSRIFSGVITGIGFLGAGAMFRQNNYVKGAASAASIWAAGAIGLICGVGLLWLAGLLSLLILALLIVSGPFTRKYDTD
jgi:putative Mg2+ transporter-C (MgtC) family protein